RTDGWPFRGSALPRMDGIGRIVSCLEKSRLADGICCWTYVSLNKMPRTDRKIDMDPALAGHMSLSRFGQGMEWIEGLHKEQWIGYLICHTAALNGFAQLKALGFLC
ncbi:unnamed protein product, partial [Brassica rapa subsp. narinosa]